MNRSICPRTWENFPRPKVRQANEKLAKVHQLAKIRQAHCFAHYRRSIWHWLDCPPHTFVRDEWINCFFRPFFHCLHTPVLRSGIVRKRVPWCTIIISIQNSDTNKRNRAVTTDRVDLNVFATMWPHSIHSHVVDGSRFRHLVKRYGRLRGINLQ